jgi:hypothetical protein
MIIWQFRDDPQVVKFMTRFVAKVGIYLFETTYTRVFEFGNLMLSLFVFCCVHM